MITKLDRVLLKLSGEALGGTSGSGLDAAVLDRLAAEVAAVAAGGTDVALVLGGGNLVRGAELAGGQLRRVTGDHMGMLATVMNALAFRDALVSHGRAARVLSAFEVPTIAERYAVDRAEACFAEGAVALFAGGTGNPFFTTDTAACLRGVEIGADAVLKGTKVDGVYDADPLRNPDARRFDALTYADVLRLELGVMDLTAIHLCRDHGMPLVVYDMNAAGALTKIVAGDKVGTRILAGPEDE